MWQTLFFLFSFIFSLAFFGSEGPGSGFLRFYCGCLLIPVKVVVLLWFSLVLCRLLWLCIAFPLFLYGRATESISKVDKQGQEGDKGRQTETRGRQERDTGLSSGPGKREGLAVHIYIYIYIYIEYLI